MAKKVFSKLQVLLILSFTILHAAPSGKINGTITDNQTKEPLWGVTVMIKGTSLGAATDLNGEYNLSLVPVGKQTVVIQYIGYKRIEVEVTVIEGESTKLDLKLDSEALQGQEVLVSAQAIGQKAAINKQLSSNSIKNVVSSARIQEVPDANAAESVGRLPGVSINRSGGEGNTVTVRGLAPRFNAVQIDGVNMGSTNKDSRQTDISGISPNMLSGIEVTKALTADMDANSLGGTVNMTVKEAPANAEYEFIAQGGYDSQEKSYGNYKILGSLSNRYLNGVLGVVLSGYAEQVNRSTDILNSSWEQENTAGVEDTIRPASFTYLDRQETRRRFGGSLVLDYQLGYGSLKFTSFGSRLSKDTRTYSQTFNPQTLGYSSDQSVGGDNFTDQVINNFSAKFDVFDGKLDFNTSFAYSQNYQPQVRSMNSYANQGTKLQDRSGPAHLWINNATIPDEMFGFNGAAFNSYSTQEREFATNLNFEYPFNLDFVSGSIKIGGNYKYKNRSHDRDNRSGNVSGNDAIANALWMDMKDVFTDGAGTRYIPLYQAWDNHWDNSKFFEGVYKLKPYISKENFDRIANSALRFYANNPNQSWNVSVDKYRDIHSGWEKSFATYIMPTLKFLDNLVTFIPGFRYEEVTLEYSGNRFTVPFSGRLEEQMFKGLIKDSTARATHKNFFPMIHLRIKPVEWGDLRLAYTETISRPNFSDLVPYQYQDPNSKSGGGGNIVLKPQTSKNWDVYTSVYSNEIGLSTVGAFYKEIDDLIWNTTITINNAEEQKEYGLDPRNLVAAYNTSINNKYKAYLGGFELDFQTNLWYLPEPFNGIVLSINYTHINSSTRYPKTDSKKIQIRPPLFTRIDTFYVAALEGQPEDVVNLSIGYDYKGFSGRISYLFQKGNLSSRDAITVLNSYLFDYSRVDAKIQQKLPLEGLEVYLNLNNITDTGDERYRYIEKFVSNKEFYGLTMDLGIRYRL